MSEKKSISVASIAEPRLLNAIYLHPEFIVDYNVQEEYFHAFARPIFNAIKQLAEEQIPLNELSIYERYARLDENASRGFVQTITNLTDSIENIRDVIEDVKITLRKEQALQLLTETSNLLEPTHLLDEETKDTIRKKLYEAEKLLLSDSDNIPIMNVEQWSDLHLEEFEKRKNGKQWSFYDKLLDGIITEGPSPGTCGLIVARSGQGKSTFIQKIVNNFLNNDVPVFWFSLEMGAVSTMDRLLSQRLRIPFKEIVNPSDYETWESIKDAILQERDSLLNHKRFRFTENPSLYLSDIKNHISKFQTDIGQKYCIVTIDLITMVKDFARMDQTGGMAQHIELAVNQLSALTKELGIHVIMVAQLKRSEKETNIKDPDDLELLRPHESEIKNSGALLERTRYCLSIFRKKHYADKYLSEEDYPEIVAMQDICEVGLLKQNQGVVGKFHLLMEPDVFNLRPLEVPEEDET